MFIPERAMSLVENYVKARGLKMSDVTIEAVTKRVRNKISVTYIVCEPDTRDVVRCEGSKVKSK